MVPAISTPSRLTPLSPPLSQLSLHFGNCTEYLFGHLGLILQPAECFFPSPAPPGSTPQNVGNAYDPSHGTTRTSESVVVRLELLGEFAMLIFCLQSPTSQWTFNSATNEINCQWVNTDGCESPPPAILEIQSADTHAIPSCRISLTASRCQPNPPQQCGRKARVCTQVPIPTSLENVTRLLLHSS